MSRLLITAFILSGATACSKKEDAPPKPKRILPVHDPKAPPRLAGSGSSVVRLPPGKSPFQLEGVGTEPARAQTAAEAEVTGTQDCPKYIGQRSTGATMVGQQSRLMSHEQGWVVLSEKRLKIFGSAPGDALRDDTAVMVPKGIAALDDTAWYVPHCKPGGCGPHGTGMVIDRVDRATREMTEIVSSQSEIVAAQILGAHLYWITYGPKGDSGELRRVPPTGGKVETLWRGRGVKVMLLEKEEAIVSDGDQVAAVPLTGGKPRILVDGLQNAGALATDADAVYIAEYGQRGSGPNGFIKRVPRKGGTVETLAGPVDFPRVVAVDDHRVYYMLSDSGSIWAIVKGSGEPPSMIVPQPPRDATCTSSVWLRADATGLIWLRRIDGYERGTVWRLTRKLLPPPPETAMAAFRRAVDEYNAGSAGSAAKPDEPADP